MNNGHQRLHSPLTALASKGRAADRGNQSQADIHQGQRTLNPQQQAEDKTAPEFHKYHNQTLDDERRPDKALYAARQGLRQA